MSDGVLSFWLKNDVIRATEGSHGRGSHRRFSAYEVTIAAILGSLQPYALRLASLRSLADLLHAAVDLCADIPLHPSSLSTAGRLAKRVHDLRHGRVVECWKYYEDEQGKLRVECVTAESVDDLYHEIKHTWSDYDAPSKIIEFSERISAEDGHLTEIFHDIATEMYGDDVADFGWLLWQDSSGGWQIASQTQPNEDFSRTPDGETAIFIAIGRIIRRVWNIDLEAKREARAYQAQLYRERQARRKRHD